LRTQENNNSFPGITFSHEKLIRAVLFQLFTADSETDPFKEFTFFSRLPHLATLKKFTGLALSRRTT
jgi:hypothetical protein